MLEWITQIDSIDPIVALMVAYIFASAVQALPKPLPEERWYGWAFSFLHSLAANHGLVHKISERNRGARLIRDNHPATIQPPQIFPER